MYRKAVTTLNTKTEFEGIIKISSMILQTESLSSHSESE